MIIDLFVINVVLYYFTVDKSNFNLYFVLYFNISWLLVAFNTRFYKIYRYTRIIKVSYLLFLQFSVFFFIYFAYFGLFKEGYNTGEQKKTIITLFTVISIIKILFLIILRKYRIGGGSIRDVIILGDCSNFDLVHQLFSKNNYLGYNYKGYFSDKDTTGSNFLGKIEDAFDYSVKEKIHQIYCSITDFSTQELKGILSFAERNDIVVKIIPDSKGAFSKGMVLEYYDYIPVLSLKKLPFDDPFIKYSKRIFDIIFSLFVIVFFLSWISIILFILIKLESKGPLFFKQKRDGLNGVHFMCYKFRSMRKNKDADNIHATKGDMRVTRIGKFIRKTSIDELPQFINVLKGDMSVVGPRPHMPTLTKEYAEVVDNYFQRNLVKPGITGLAQVKGCRGNVETNADIENRVRYDIFYINNWSLLLDIKIIIQTVTNAFKGEENAY